MGAKLTPNGGVVFDWDEPLVWGRSPDCADSHKEGWDLFLHTGRGELEIEAITDLEEVGCKPEDALGTNDNEVVNALIARASKGSRRHMLALYLDGRRVEHGYDIWVPASLVHPDVLRLAKAKAVEPIEISNDDVIHVLLKSMSGATLAEEIEKRMVLAKHDRKEVIFYKATGKWAWRDKTKGRELDLPAGPFSTFLEALFDATRFSVAQHKEQ